MNLFKRKYKSNENKQSNNKHINIWDIPCEADRKIIWDMYLSARDMEDQSLAKEIANDYGIDYDFPVITNKMIHEVEQKTHELNRFEEEKRIRNIVIEVLKEKGLTDK